MTGILFFPVGNGDMTLIELQSGKRILIDVDIRTAADNPDDETFDVARALRQRLTRDSYGRLFVDAFLLTHPDKDHCTGLRKHFHLGPPSDWSSKSDKILIREQWSSPIVFRRASSQHVLCDDAKAWCAEARRRVRMFRETPDAISDGDRILILGEDEDNKTEGLEPILVRTGDLFSRVNGQNDLTLEARLLAPRPKSEDDEEEERRSKNHSSTIINFQLASPGNADAARFLSGGDAEVAIWESLWELYNATPELLRYDILQTPHHCSWHSLSYDSWSWYGEKAKICEGARKALGQTRRGAFLVTSSRAIKDDENDPPCIRAKREYVSIANEAKGSFICVGEYPSEKASEILEFEIVDVGPRIKSRPMKAAAVVGAGSVGRSPLGHGT
jgi:hypothetical protein